MKKIVVMLICSLMFLIGNHTANAVIKKDVPILMKINDYYILYTNPHAPFIDGRGRLLIPLKSIRDLMGGRIMYNEKNKTAYVTWLDHQYTFTIGSKIAVIDGEKVEMDTVPTLINNSMFLPIKFLLEKTDVKSRWNTSLDILEINDERVENGRIFTFFKDQDYADVKENRAFHLSSYSIEQTSTGAKKLCIKARNITGHLIPYGKADIHPVFLSGHVFSMDSYTRPMQKPLKSIKENEIITYTQTFDIKKIDYIISVARELN
ncbi:MAG: copper amine oxidase N-terminal domain-containing protein [Anoxybacillus gonensis]|nr:copper amine oxidase N-terminal domain-containing protein [Anoxybacillus gonensis]